jgi:N-acetylneuraminic acid mutarotase
MRKSSVVVGGVLLLGALAITAAGAFIVGRRWPIARIDAMVARLRPEATASALLPWHVTDTVPITRYENATALIGNELFVIGGFYNEQIQVTTQVNVLDLTTHQWRRAADLPVGVTHVNAVVLGDSVIWLVGGFSGNHPGPAVATTLRYVVKADRWEAGPPLPLERAAGALVAVGDTLHYFGGFLPDRNTDSPDHWRLTPGALTWEVRAPLPDPRGHLSAMVMDGAIYAIGGNHGHDPIPVDVGTILRYDLAADRWSPMASLPHPRSHSEPGTIAWRDRVLLVGGRNYPGSTATLGDVTSWSPRLQRTRFELPLPMGLLAPAATVFRDTLIVGAGAPFDGEPTNPLIWRAALTGTWLRFPALPLALGEVSAAVLGDRLFVLGEGAGHTLAFDLRTGEWEPMTQWSRRPGLGHHHALEVWNDQLVLVGGLGWSEVGSVTQFFDVAANSWRLGPRLPIPLGSSASAVISGRLYLAGGISGNQTVAAGFVLDSASGTWRTIAPMPKPRNHAASATDGNRLWVFGGRGPGSGDSNVVANGFADVQVYDPATDRWTVSDGSAGAPLPLPQARGGMGKAVFLDGEFWVFGGETLDGEGASTTGVYDRVDIYDPIARRWRAGPPLRTGMHGIFPVIDDGRILIAGGGDRAGHSVTTRFEVLRPR